MIPRIYLRWLALLAATVAAVLIPFFLWGEAVETWLRAALRTETGWALAAALVTGVLAGDVFLPVPSSLVSTAGGALLGFAGGLAASWVGMTAGCLMGYWLGQRFTTDGEVRSMEKARERWGDWLVVVFRPVPVLAEASVFFAGVTRMPLRRFAALSGLANLGISAVYAWAGSRAAGTETFLWAFVAALAVPGLGMLVFSPARASRRSPE